MSYLDSPYSNWYYQDEEYGDDRFDDDDDREEDESGEDTEDASETDTGHQEPLEIKEQMYQDKLASLKKKLQQLKEGTHHEYNRKVKKLEYQLRERRRMNDLFRDLMIETIEKDYIQEKKAAVKEFEEKKIDLRENLISDLEDKKRNVEAERYSMELTGDSMEVKPVMTRKLRRRPNDPMPVPEKRRKAPAAQITYLLEEKDIESDLRAISRGKMNAQRKIDPLQNSPNQIQGIVMNSDPQLIETRVEDGKLLYEKRWFHRGQSVFVEGRDMNKFPGHIVAIGNEAVAVKKVDGTKVKLHISHLAKGKCSLKRRAS